MRTYTLADLRALRQTRVVHDVKAAGGEGSQSGGARSGDVRRFSAGERMVHRATGILMLLRIASGAEALRDDSAR